MPRLHNLHFAVFLVPALLSMAASRSQSPAPVLYCVIALAEPGNGLQQCFQKLFLNANHLAAE